MQAPQFDHKPTKILITGSSGSGKTTYFRRYLRGSASRYKHTFVFDQEAELWRLMGFTPCYNEGDIEQSLSTGWTFYDYSEMFPGDPVSGFDWFCDYAFQMSEVIGGHKIFCCDELQNVVTPYDVPYNFKVLMYTGRRRGLDAILIAQSPNLIHGSIRNMITEAVTFQHVAENAIKFHNEIGFSEDQIRALRPGQYLVRNLKTGATASGKVF